MTCFPTLRLRRLRQHHCLREMVRETWLRPSQLIAPLFVVEGEHIRAPIPSMPHHYRYSVDQLVAPIMALQEVGIISVLLFGVPDPAHKDATGSIAASEFGVVQRAIRAIKRMAPEMQVIADLCLCEYTSHGHCGMLPEAGNTSAEAAGAPGPGDDVAICNDPTLLHYGTQAISLVEAGADIIAPSGMMDGMVQAIRRALDDAGHGMTPLMSYAVKYASAFYGPFRDAAAGAPSFGTRRTYQMDPANRLEALREAALDVAEGADILMVKPAHTYLDVIAAVKAAHPSLPLAAYHTSGEYAMLEAAIARGWMTEDAILEVTTSIARAGANLIITYYAEHVARLLCGQPLPVRG